MSYGLWQRRFGEDPAIIGQQVEVNSQRMHVVGVMPRDFQVLLAPDALMPTDIDVWTMPPVALSDWGRGAGNLTIIGRLTEGASLDQARGEFSGLATYLRETYPVHSRLGTELHMGSLYEEVVGPVRVFLWVLFGAVGFVLLIACANVANLLLMRAAAREQEFAVRRALGGDRGRIFRQLLTESLVISALGALAGLLIARWGVELLLALRPDNLPRLSNVGIDGSVLAFTMGSTLLAAIFFGMAPAIRSSGGELTLASRGDVSGSRKRRRMRSALIVGEVALSVVLLVGAGLLLRSFGELRDVRPGFRSAGIVTADLSLPFFTYRESAKRQRFYEDLLTAVNELPEVQSAGGIDPVPLSNGGGGVQGFALDLEDAQSGDEPRLADYRIVLPGFIKTVGTTVLQGRAFTEDDMRAEALPVVMVDSRLAARTWPDQSPVGERILVGVPAENQSGSVVEAEIVGLVEHIRHNDLTADGRGTIYLPARMNPWFEMSLVVRSDAEPLAVAAAIRRELAKIDPTLPLFGVRRLDDYVADAMAPTRFALTLIGIFALVALTLASVGLYGVVSTSVQQRTREIGVRIAMGAQEKRILRLVVGQGLRLALIRVAVGLGGAFLLTGVMSGLLFGVAPTDPITFTLTPLALTAVAALACYLPARRASRVDPVEALRE